MQRHVSALCLPNRATGPGGSQGLPDMPWSHAPKAPLCGTKPLQSSSDTVTRLWPLQQPWGGSNGHAPPLAGLLGSTSAPLQPANVAQQLEQEMVVANMACSNGVGHEEDSGFGDVTAADMDLGQEQPAHPGPMDRSASVQQQQLSFTLLLYH